MRQALGEMSKKMRQTLGEMSKKKMRQTLGGMSKETLRWRNDVLKKHGMSCPMRKASHGSDIFNIHFSATVLM